MDDTFDATERTTIERLLAARFDLDGGAVQRLLSSAEDAAERSSQLYSFIHVVVETVGAGGPVQIVEMMWEVAYADGVLDPDEGCVAAPGRGLLYVSDYDRGARANACCSGSASPNKTQKRLRNLRLWEAARC